MLFPWIYLMKKFWRKQRKKIFRREEATLMLKRKKNPRILDPHVATGPGRLGRLAEGCLQLGPWTCWDMGSVVSWIWIPSTLLKHIWVFWEAMKNLHFHTFYFVLLYLNDKDPRFILYIWEENMCKLNLLCTYHHLKYKSRKQRCKLWFINTSCNIMIFITSTNLGGAVIGASPVAQW